VASLLSMRAVWLVALLGLAGLALAFDLPCPTVVDGSQLRFDIDEQSSPNEISANWFGAQPQDVLRYEWAVISDNLLTEAMLDDGCRSSSGLSGLPDVQPWTAVRNTVASNRLVNLQPGIQYFVLLRTILRNGKTVYSNSDGFELIPELNQAEESDKQPRSVGGGPEAAPRRKILNKVARSYVTDTCPIDEANRCNQVLNSQFAVANFLTAVYGPPIWKQTSQATLLYRLPTTAEIAAEIGLPTFGAVIATESGFATYLSNSTSSDDNDNGYHLSPGGIVGIAVGSSVGGGVLLLGLLLLILLVVLVLILLIGFCCMTLLGPKKFDENFTIRTQDVVDTDIGRRTEPELGDSNTRVEFPDLDAPS